MSNTHSNHDETTTGTTTPTDEPEVLGAETGGAGSNAEKPADQWVTGDEDMTGAQRSYLDTLAREAGETLPAAVCRCCPPPSPLLSVQRCPGG